MPLYGRAFASTAGPGTLSSGAGGEGSWENGVWDFKVLPQSGAEEYVDEGVGASWSFDEERRVMVSYDNKAMAKIKVDFVKRHGLGGAMWWESSGDRQGHDGLIHTVRFCSLRRYRIVCLSDADERNRFLGICTDWIEVIIR